MARLNKKIARSLAIRYHAYLEACHADDYSGIVCWGPLLVEAQCLTGIVLCDPEGVNALTHGARRKIVEREREQCAAAVAAA